MRNYPKIDVELSVVPYSRGEGTWTPEEHVHPRQWSQARKAYDTCLIVFLEFFTTMISTAGSPVAGHIYGDLGISPVSATCIFVSTYLIGQTIGGVFFPPWSESFGRKKLYVISTGLYSLSCILVGRVPTIPGIVVGRFVGGLLSSVPTIVAAGSIEDLWDTNARVWWLYWWSLVANLGILTGPVFSDLVMRSTHWTWVFYTAAIVTACVTMLLLTIKESRPSVVLAMAQALSEVQGLSSNTTSPGTVFPSTREKLDLLRPLRFFFTEPIVFLAAVVSAIAFGLVYLFTEVLPLVYVDMGFTDASMNLPFLPLAIGMVFSALTRLYDRRVLAERMSRSLPLTPESKFAGFIIGAPLLAIGLWWFAWTIPPYTTSAHWAIPTVALVPIGYAVNEFDYVLAGYLTDCYQTYSASGYAAMSLVRSTLSSTFPLLGRALFDSLDSNMASSVFAALATVLCVVPPLLLRYGSTLRAKSAFASKDSRDLANL
ncbi:fluconazole resistance protein 1 [Colletotrichum godetiae]|uniref:Fluconazole resistance protein 1 n=1 Tax=Colletotrichum godetiae TaxID=1209918 RepID=A0AAJ0EQ22_9PEZI|nr:fluconazole resistance protein 1 [Colletotrichum godetiae]KAK1671122.1 fluconazole resistance protein 1 [Colletotrichum godetiae]